LALPNLDPVPEEEAPPSTERSAIQTEGCNIGEPAEEPLSSAVRPVRLPPRANRWRTLAERASSLGARVVRLLTDLPTLDGATRGGFPTGRTIAIGGPPGACKTGLVLAMGQRWIRQGIYVAILAADEDANGLLIRMGQAEGFARDELERGAPEIREAVTRRMGELDPRLYLVDAEEEDNASIEDVAEALRARANGAPAVLIIDSIQTARLRESGPSENRRDEIDAKLRCIKRAAKRFGLLVIFTTELARGAYRASRPAWQTNDLAAGKESGSIEYGVSVLIVLRAVPGADGLIDVTIPKNRLGRRPSFRFAFDPERATISEVPMPEQPVTTRSPHAQASQVRASRSRRGEDLEGRIIQAVREAPEPLTSKNAICRAAGGTKSKVLNTVKELLSSGRLTKNGKVFVASTVAKAPASDTRKRRGGSGRKAVRSGSRSYKSANRTEPNAPAAKGNRKRSRSTQRAPPYRA
jgi:KaiC/GvpD/RAD55 family RecA-like ATPase